MRVLRTRLTMSSVTGLRTLSMLDCRRAHLPASTLPIGVRIGMTLQFPVSVVLVGTRVTFWVLTAGIDDPVRGRDPSMPCCLSVCKAQRCARVSQRKTCEVGGPGRGSNLSTFRYLPACGFDSCESVARGGYEVGDPVRGSDLRVFCYRLARGKWSKRARYSRPIPLSPPSFLGARRGG